MTASRIRTLVRALPALLLAAALAAPPSASAELAKWDQERVTAIAGELANAIKDLRKAVRQVPPPTVGQPGTHSYYELLDTLGGLESASKRLNKALADGKGREETSPTYRRLMRGVRDAQEYARRLELGAPVLDRVAVAGDALRRLRPYYEEEDAS